MSALAAASWPEGCWDQFFLPLMSNPRQPGGHDGGHGGHRLQSVSGPEELWELTYLLGEQRRRLRPRRPGAAQGLRYGGNRADYESPSPDAGASSSFQASHPFGANSNTGLSLGLRGIPVPAGFRHPCHPDPPQCNFCGACSAGSLGKATGVTLEVGRCQDFSRKEGGAQP